MRVVVNGLPLLGPLTGIGQYVRHLFTAMQELPNVELTMYYGTRCETGMRLPDPNKPSLAHRGYGLLSRFLPGHRTLRRAAEKLVFSYHTHKGFKSALYHEPNYTALPYNGPTVITVCDLSCFDHPETHPIERVRLMQRDLPGSLERADHVIVISEATASALKHWFSVPDHKITTTYLAADARFYPRDPVSIAPSLLQFGLEPGQYILCVGTLEPRKNLPALFSAYASLPEQLRDRFPLVVAGMKGWHTDELLKSAEILRQRGQLRMLGYVEDALIPVLYAGAAAFAYPSRYEGFGLPALEAMASGVPVITSNQTSLPEVVGDAGLMTDPDDIEGMQSHLRMLLEDRDFAHALAQRGLQRAREFSWTRCARETYSVYERVLKARC